jgi:hypothetical protein
VARRQRLAAPTPALAVLSALVSTALSIGLSAGLSLGLSLGLGTAAGTAAAPISAVHLVAANARTPDLPSGDHSHWAPGDRLDSLAARRDTGRTLLAGDPGIAVAPATVRPADGPRTRVAATRSQRPASAAPTARRPRAPPTHDG